MLSLFKSKALSSKHIQEQRRHGLLQNTENRKLEQKSLVGANRQLYEYNKPEQDLGTADLLKQHVEGSRFLYAAITGREEETHESRLRKLWAWKPNLKISTESFSEIPNLKLYKESETFPIKPLIDSLKSRKGMKLGDFFRVVEAAVIFGAVVSPDHEFTKVRIAMHDGRLLSSTQAKGFIADTNKESRGDLRMPYCIPVENADLLSLVISRENQFLQDEVMWGVIKVRLSIEFSEFPKQYDNLDVTATNMLVSTTLEDRITNPDRIDISTTDMDRLELAKLYVAGDVVDVDTPEKNQTKKASAKSSIRELKKGDHKSFGKGWGEMTIPRPPAAIGSVEPDSDEEDTPSDIARKDELLRNHKLNQEAARSENMMLVKTDRRPRLASPHPPLTNDSENMTQVKSDKKPRFATPPPSPTVESDDEIDDVLNVFT